MYFPRRVLPILPFFFFNDTATTEIYTLSLHDALPISSPHDHPRLLLVRIFVDIFPWTERRMTSALEDSNKKRSEEHTSELQSLTNLVCRLLLEKKQEALEAARRARPCRGRSRRLC